MAVLDLNAWRILAQIVTGSGTEGIGISPDGRDVYTSSVNINELVRIDMAPCRWSGARRWTTASEPCASCRRRLLVDADTLKVRHDMTVGTISVIDIRRGAVARTIPAGDEPDGIVFVMD